MIFNEYNILLTPSNMLFKQTIVCMISAMQSCNNPINFYIMESDWSYEQKISLSEYMKGYFPNTVKYVTVNDDNFKCFKPYKGHYGMYYKLMAHYYISENNGFENINRVMYLDIDTIVVKDVYDFYSVDLDNYYLYAPVHPDFTEYSFEEYARREDKGKWPNYAVCGSLIINLEVMRTKKIDIDFYLDKINKLDYEYDIADEGVINIAFWDKIKFFPYYKYNYFLSYHNRYKKAFHYNKQERVEKCNDVYHEDFDEKNFAAIVHFASYMIPKPWNTFIDKNNKKVLGTIGNNVPDLFYEYYEMWWNNAKKIPLEYYEELLKNALEIVIAQPINVQLNAVKDILYFFEALAYDDISELKFVYYIQSLKGKRISILKSYDTVSKYFIKSLKSNGINIVFSTGKASLTALTSDEWEQCKKADVIINCDVHGSKSIERDGIKPVMIWNILKDDLSLPKEKNFSFVISSNKLLTEINETKNQLNRAKNEISEKICQLSERMSIINNIRIEKDRLDSANKELSDEKVKLIAEKNTLKENIKDLKIQHELLCADKTNLNQKLHNLITENSVYSIKCEDQIKKLTDELNNTVFQRNDFKKQTEIQANEIRALTQQLAEIQASRSWKITKPLRSLKAIFVKQK